MKDVISKLDEWSARGERAAVATVVGEKRSAPRPPGAKMAGNDRGEVWGAVSGGCVEGAGGGGARDGRQGGEVGLVVGGTVPAPGMIILGAGGYAEALCRLARACSWRPYVVDPRSRFATRERFPEAEEVVAAWPADALPRLGGVDRATYI